MALGLAIGMDAMRACAATPRWHGLRMRWCGLARLPRELIQASPREENIASVARFCQHLVEAFRGRRFRRRMHVGLPDPSARIRVLFADDLPQDPDKRRKYLLWRLADALDCEPARSRLSYMALPSPLPGRRYAVTCAVAGEQVVRQYEGALAESQVRYSGIAPSTVLLFNLFEGHLAGPPGVPVLLLAATEEALTTVITLDGCAIFWRSRALLLAGNAGRASDNGWHGELVRDVLEAVAYGEDQLGVGPPGRLLVTGPLAAGPGLADWLGLQVRLPTRFLDARKLLTRVPRPLASEGCHRWAAALGAAARR